MPVEISILAGGWSAAQFDFDQLPGTVIGVNEGALCPCAHTGITMDRLWMEYRQPRVANSRTLHKFWSRRSAIQNIRWRSESRVAPTIFECDNESTVMNNRLGHLNGTSSGMCAINLAWQMLTRVPKEEGRVLYLFGFDCNRSPEGSAYWHEPYPWSPKGATSRGKYTQWASEYFDVARQFAGSGIQVFNMSATSLIAAFPRGPIERIPKAWPAK